MAPKVPPELIDSMLQQAASGMGVREISAWLKAQHNVSASPATVARYIAKESKERSEAARSVTRTKLAKSVTRDLDRLELFARKAMRIAKKCEGKPAVWALVSREVRQFTVARLKLAGAGGEADAAGTGRVVFLPAEDPD